MPSRREREICVLFVGFDADDGALRARRPTEQFRPAHHFRRMLERKAVVAGDVGLALRAVDKEEVRLGLGREFDVCGEPRAAHADDAALLHSLPDLLGRGIGKGRKGDGVALEVVDDLDVRALPSRSRRTGDDARDSPRYGRVHARGNKTAALTYELPCFHLVARLDHGDGGSSDVLGEGNIKTFRRGKLRDRNAGCGFAGGRVCPSAERFECDLQFRILPV